jgi:uncharacterized cofD-like protein
VILNFSAISFDYKLILTYDKNWIMSKENKKIVCLGGGNAMPNAVLKGLKDYPLISISVICATLDSGGFAGEQRKKYNTISFGDIRRSFLALSNVTQETKDVLSNRNNAFGEDTVLLVNTIGTTSVVVGKSLDYEKAIRVYREILQIPDNYKVLYATVDNSNLFAKLENGNLIEGETNIDVPKHDGSLKIKEALINPEAKAYPPAIEEIRTADLIVIGPGDLFSSIAQILLVKGISEALRESKAKKVYICNLMTKNGETNNFSVSDFAEKIEEWLHGDLDFVLYNTNKPSGERLNQYKTEHKELIGFVEVNNNLDPKKFIGRDLLTVDGPIVHDSKKIAENLINLCK